METFGLEISVPCSRFLSQVCRGVCFVVCQVTLTLLLLSTSTCHDIWTGIKEFVLYKMMLLYLRHKHLMAI